MKAIIVMPTYNESENLPQIVEAILNIDEIFDILVVDDNSPDGTGKIADEISSRNPRVKVLHRPKKSGLGTAYIEGFKRALKDNYDVIFEMDADFSHHPRYLMPMLKVLENADIVVGSRYIRGVNVVNWPMSRLLLSYFANIYTRIITGMPVRDATAGFVAIRRKVLESINLDEIKSDGYSFQIELKFRAYKKGFRIVEIPIIFEDRVKGRSKMSKKIVREAAIMVWRLRLMSIFNKL